MDAIRVSKVEHVVYNKSGVVSIGTLHLTAHHLIFRHEEKQDEETWVPYPLISLVSRLPQTIQGLCPLSILCRNFEAFTLSFSRESDAIDVFDSVKELTVASSVEQLYAFFYTPNPPLPTSDGWSIYSPREEFGRMGVGTRTKAWRFTDINKDYSFSPTYPARLVIPTKISDTTLQYASKYRSKCRIPALTYLHWANYGSITRSSQPMVGLTQSRSIQDEKLIEAIFQSHYSPESRASSGPIYGATATNLIIDARPTTNAVANTAKGAGTENMDHYREGKKAYLGIDNIHVMRDSLAKVVEALREADNVAATINRDLPVEVAGLATLDRQALRRSGWLRHLSAIMEGSLLITRNVHVNSSHVFIHCSDGWDRTAQLSSLSQLCLDPFYRTIRGFEILIEKDWVSFGHKFLDRCGHLSSDKFFVSPTELNASGAGSDAAQAFLSSVQNRFVSQHHLKETSPVFHQFLESVRQVQRQFPDRFEYNERFLRTIHYHLYSCQFGTFLFNSEHDRRVSEGGGPPPCDRTLSFWDFLNSPEERAKNLNPSYDTSLDDPRSRQPKADMGVLFLNPKDVRFWNELYGRSDEEMNGRAVAVEVPNVEFVGPIEDAEDDPAIPRSGTPLSMPLPPSPSKTPTPMNTSHGEGLARVSKVDSPLLGSSLRELSASLPNITGTDSSTSQPVSSSPSWAPRPSSSSSSNSPFNASRARSNKPTDFFASSGVKSVWGKLSSNASAALSVMQDAYEGVSKDFKAPGSNDPTPTDGELRSRETLNGWGEDAAGSSTGFPSSHAPVSNPWASVKASPSIPPASYDNPWGSVRTSPSTRSQTQPLTEASEPSPLFLDASLSPTHSRTMNSPRLSAPIETRRGSNSVTPIPPNKKNFDPPSTSNTDPLGVGPL